MKKRDLTQRPGINFINVFMPSFYTWRSQKRKSSLSWLSFCSFGSACLKAARKHVDEIGTWRRRALFVKLFGFPRFLAIGFFVQQPARVFTGQLFTLWLVVLSRHGLEKLVLQKMLKKHRVKKIFIAWARKYWNYVQFNNFCGQNVINSTSMVAHHCYRQI